MIKFHTEFDICKPPFFIEHSSRIFLLGSCFTENIGAKLGHYKFNVLQNPNGILFNPQSVADVVHQYANLAFVQEADLFYLNSVWNSWLHHTRFSAVTPNTALNIMNGSIQRAHDFLLTADIAVITFGSAWVYELLETVPNRPPSNIAANNHRAPANWFKKVLLSPGKTQEVITSTVEELRRLNPEVRIIFTISPVRHIREGLVNNNRSKAALIYAVHEVASSFANVYYFPAYELVIDDLRDYRFYAEDLVHPNYQSSSYVWQKLITSCFSPSAKLLLEKLDPILSAVAHKPMNPESAAHKSFVEKIITSIEQLEAEYSYLDFSHEKAALTMMA